MLAKLEGEGLGEQTLVRNPDTLYRLIIRSGGYVLYTIIRTTPFTFCCENIMEFSMNSLSGELFTY